MTISLNTPRNTYTATAGQTDFTIGFEFFAVADVKAYKNGTLLTYNASSRDLIGSKKLWKIILLVCVHIRSSFLL